jgi:hypothetical protein
MLRPLLALLAVAALSGPTDNPLATRSTLDLDRLSLADALSLPVWLVRLHGVARLSWAFQVGRPSLPSRHRSLQWPLVLPERKTSG